MIRALFNPDLYDIDSALASKFQSEAGLISIPEMVITLKYSIKRFLAMNNPMLL